MAELAVHRRYVLTIVYQVCKSAVFIINFLMEKGKMASNTDCIFMNLAMKSTTTMKI